MNLLAIIPARGGSKGVPGKNIKPLQGKPLLYYTLDTVVQMKEITTICVSTDDPHIQSVANQYNGNNLAPFLRPDNLAADKSPTLPLMLHALDFYENQSVKYDAVLLFQPTVPFRSITMVRHAIQKFQTTQADSLISVRVVPHHYNPHWVFEAKDSDFLKIATGELELITRRQALPPAYYRDGSLYITKVDILRNGSLYGEKVTYWLNKDEPHFNIDTVEDWQNMEQYFDQPDKAINE